MFSSRGPRSGPAPLVGCPAQAGHRGARRRHLVGADRRRLHGQRRIHRLHVSNGSGFIPDSAALSLNGTSMAAPHMAGIMALLRQLHPAWTVEELKALAMNRALHDVTTLPGGRARASVPAASAPAASMRRSPRSRRSWRSTPRIRGASASRSTSRSVIGTATRTKTIRSSITARPRRPISLAIDTVVDAPGVRILAAGQRSVTVPPGQTIDVPVRIDDGRLAAWITRAMRRVSATQSLVVFGLAILRSSVAFADREAGYLTLRRTERHAAARAGLRGSHPHRRDECAGHNRHERQPIGLHDDSVVGNRCLHRHTWRRHMHRHVLDGRRVAGDAVRTAGGQPGESGARAAVRRSPVCGRGLFRGDGQSALRPVDLGRVEHADGHGRQHLHRLRCLHTGRLVYRGHVRRRPRRHLGFDRVQLESRQHLADYRQHPEAAARRLRHGGVWHSPGKHGHFAGPPSESPHRHRDRFACVRQPGGVHDHRPRASEDLRRDGRIQLSGADLSWQSAALSGVGRLPLRRGSWPVLVELPVGQSRPELRRRQSRARRRRRVDPGHLEYDEPDEPRIARRAAAPSSQRARSTSRSRRAGRRDDERSRNHVVRRTGRAIGGTAGNTDGECHQSWEHGDVRSAGDG